MYDAIVVGARCAGSPTAMLLARKGYRVLLVDKTSFPSDTLSVHYIHQAGVARLARWGLLDRLASRTLARGYAERLQVKMAGLDQPVAALSGGNQQKVVLAK